jgi:hypothetical protein
MSLGNFLKPVCYNQIMKKQDKATSRQAVKTKTAKTAKKRRTVPLYDAELMTPKEFFNLGSDNQRKAKPVGWSSNPDDFGPMIVDSKTFEKLCGLPTI